MAGRLVMTAAEVAAELGYLRRSDRQPDVAKVRNLCREGRLPAPIDDGLPVVDWRWSRRRIEQYVAGDIKPRAVAS